MQRQQNRCVLTPLHGTEAAQLHPMRPFQVAVAARIGSQWICRVQRHRSAGRCQIISSRASAEAFRIRSFEPADRCPSPWRKPPPAPRHLLHWWISLIAGHTGPLRGVTDPFEASRALRLGIKPTYA